MAFSYNDRVLNDLKLKKIEDVAKKAGILSKYIKHFGPYMAKIAPEIYEEKLKNRRDGKYILMTSITPTYLGEGKTTNAIGASMAINKLGKKSIVCLRQPSLGPTFGVKGVGTGGGYSQVAPQKNINMGLTGDFYAVANAQNLCASVLDNSFFWENPEDFIKDRISWNRAMDVSDRSLRNITIGGGGKLHGISRKSSIDITTSCECMDILSLSKDLKDLRARLGNIVVGYSQNGTPITAENLKTAGAMAVILMEALRPNIVQTIEGTPCLMHGGSFADISLGSSSVMADRIALKLADYVITEAGAGADLGAEKFINIKCRQSGLRPDVAVINCSVRALKMHSGDFKAKGALTAEPIKREDLSAVDRGCSNLEKQVENLKIFGIPVVVCINRFEKNTKKELNVIVKRAEALDVDGIAVSEAYSSGSEGAKELGQAIIQACKVKSKFHFLYPVDMNIKNKIERISKSMYGASDIKYSDDAIESIELIEKAKLFDKPICMGKTALSLSTSSKKKGRPKGFTLGVDSVKLAAGAGYISVLCDGKNKMPGLPQKPRLSKIDVDVKTGKIKGLL